jgi:hypothetical protein
MLGLPVPKFDGCNECTRIHDSLEAEVSRMGDDDSSAPNLGLIMELIQHVRGSHQADMELAKVKHDQYLEKMRDHNSNPLVRAFREADDDREPAFEGDSTSCGLATVKATEPNAWADGYCDHLLNDVYPVALADAGWSDFGHVLRALLNAAFYGGVYAERNRLLSDPIAL